MKRNKTVLFLLTLLSFNILVVCFGPAVLASTESYEDTIANVITKNLALQSNFFGNTMTSPMSAALTGVGHDNSGIVDIKGGSNSYAVPKAIATAAFFRRFLLSGSTVTHSWASDTLWNELKSTNFKKNNKLVSAESDASGNTYSVVDNMIALEFLSSSFRDSQEITIKSFIDGLFAQRPGMEADTGVTYAPTSANHIAYWTEITGEGQNPDLYDKNIEYDANDYYRYPQSITSFWAIAGMINYGLAVRGSVSDLTYSLYNNSVEDAKKAMAYAETEFYFNGTGYKLHKYDSSNTLVFRVQALAVLAYARLYQATQIQSYLDEAESIIVNSITRYFLDPTKGAINKYDLNIGAGSDIKSGYDNALYAYALMELYKATGIAKYLNRATEIINFMNNYMFKITGDAKIQAYIEYTTRDGTAYDPLPADKDPISGESLDNAGQIGTTARFWTTNALVMMVNEDMYYQYLPWYIKYWVWELVIAIAAVGIIAVLILVRKRGKRGTKLSKTVKALID